MKTILQEEETIHYSITNVSCQSHWYHLRAAWLQRTSSWRSICKHPGKNEGCSKITENFQTGMSRHLESSTTTKNGQNHGPVWRAQSFLLSEISTVILWQDCYGKGNFEKIRLQYGWEKVSNWECLFVQRSYLCMWMTNKWLERNKILIQCGNYSTKKSIWVINIFPWSGESGVHSKTMWNKQKYCGQLQNHVWIANFRLVNRSFHTLRIFVFSSWSYDMEGHAKKCAERYCELSNKTTQQLYKVSAPCIDDHHINEEEMKSVGELSEVCSQLFYLARIGRPDILWSVNNFSSLITKWTKAVDTRLNRFISYIHHTCEYKQCCYVDNTAKQCTLGLFQDSDFAGDLEDSKSTSGGTLCVLGSHTFVPISWMCKKQTSVSHSSTEWEIISLDAGIELRRESRSRFRGSDCFSPWKHDSDPW